MINRKYVPVILIMLALLVGACSPSNASPAATMETQADLMETAETDSMAENMEMEAMDSDEAGEVMEEGNKDVMEHDTDASMDADADSMSEAHTDETMLDGDDHAMLDDGEAMMEADDSMLAPEWFSVVLADVQSGEMFTINDLKGNVILLETLAQWCSNCLKQQREVLALHEQLGEREDFVSIGLDIDPNEDTASLQAYAERHGFTWRYVVSPLDVSRAIANQYGDQFLNPPSTPMLVIDRKGEVHPLPFGIKSAGDLQQALEPFLQTEM